MAELQTRRDILMFDVRGLQIAILVAMVLLGPLDSHAEDRSASALNRELIFYAGRGNLDEVNSLLGRGADPNATNEFGQTVLHRAALGGSLEVVELLLAEGADATKVSQNGDTVIELVGGRQSTEVTRILIDAGAKPSAKALARASRTGQQSLIMLLLKSGVSASEGLASASQAGRVDVVKLLLDNGADVNAKSAGGVTALQTGALQGGPEVVRALLAAGADPNIRDDRGKTALHRAVTGNGDPEVVKLLLGAKAMPNTADHEGMTPLREAAMRGGGPIYEMLLTANEGKESRKLPADADQRKDESTDSLIAALAGKDSKNRESAELALLARGKEILPELSNALDGENPVVLLSLISKLGPDAESLQQKLEALLGDKDYVFDVTLCLERIKAGTIQQLPIDTRAKAASAFYEALIDPANAQVAGFYLRILPAYGEPAAPFVLKLLQSDQPGLRSAGAKCVSAAAFHDESLERALVQVIRNDEVVLVRGYAAHAAHNPLYQTDEVLQAIVQLFSEVSVDGQEGAHHVATQASFALTSFGKVVVAELLPFLEAGGDSARPHVVGIWKQLDAVSELADLLDHKDENVSLAASVSLMRRGPLAAKEVAKKLDSMSEPVRRRAANTLATMRVDDDAVVSRLVDIAGDKANTSLTRIAAARAALLQSPESARQADAVISLIPELIAALDDDAFLHRGDAAEALGLIGPAAEAAVPVLQEILHLERAANGIDGINSLYVTEKAEKALRSIKRENNR